MNDRRYRRWKTFTVLTVLTAVYLIGDQGGVDTHLLKGSPVTYYPDPRSAPESAVQRSIREALPSGRNQYYDPGYGEIHDYWTDEGVTQYLPTPGRIQPVYAARTVPTSGLAVTALVLGLAGGGLFALIFGLCAMPAINAGRRRGDGVATAGIVLGALGLAGWLLFMLVVTS